MLALATVLLLLLPHSSHGGISVPDAPVDVEAVSGESGTAVVTFRLDDEAYEPAVFGPPRFRVTSVPVNVSGTATPLSFATVLCAPAFVHGLQDGHAYTFSVQSQNGAGDVAGSGAVATTAPIVIGAPARVTSVTTIPLNRSVTVIWEPAVSRAAPVGVYIVTADPPHVAPVLANGTQASVSVGPLTNGVGYMFTVVARNAFGDSRGTSTSSLSYPQGRV